MFKRANKVTALLVAAASVMSIVPAMASTRLGTKDGHITGGAVAYSDGKYAYSGYRTDEDNTGIYYNNGTEEKEKFNSDLDDYKLFDGGKAAKYGSKYVYAVDNKDQYLVDLSNGKIVDNETPEDKADAVKSKLKSTLKKTDRYSNTGSWATVNLGDSLENEVYDANTRILSDRFGEVWYKYSARSDNSSKEVKNTQIGNVATAATFTLQLPSTLPTTNFKINNLASGVIPQQATKAAFALQAIKILEADTNVTALFDKTTFKYNDTANTITATAVKTGTIESISKTDADAFRANYSITAGLGLTKVDPYVFKEGTTTAQAVTLATEAKTQDVVDAARILVNQYDNAVEKDILTSHLNAIEVRGTTVGNTITAAQVISVTKLASNPTTATLADYTASGIKNVAEKAVSGVSIDVATANNLIAKAGKLGDAYSDAYKQQQAIQALVDAAVASGDTALAQVTLNDGKIASGGVLGVPAYYTGYVNEDGKYIDVSSMANIYVYSAQAGKSVKIKEFGKENEDYGITIGIHQELNAAGKGDTGFVELAQDKDYIYAAVKVDIAERVYDKVKGKFIDKLVGDGTLQTQYFVLKISKAQGDKKDDAYLPKSVDAYQIDSTVTGAKQTFNDGDTNDGSKTLLSYVIGDDTISCDSRKITAINVKDGVLYATGVKHDGDKDNVKIFKLSLKKGKLDTLDGKEKDVDAYIVKKDGDNDVDIRLSTDEHITDAISYDVDGNTWAVGKGVVTKFTGTDKKEMFTCDRTFTYIDAYDDNNVIVWGDQDEVYSNVAEGTKVTQAESTAVAPVVTTGWVKGTDGTWTFNDVTGTKLTSKWINDKGAWYYLKADGIMATGWYNDNGTWYYLNPASGAMATGWLNDNGTWYYLAGSGAMLSNTVVDGYTLGGSGAWVK